MEEAKQPIPGLRRQGSRLLWRASKAAIAKGYPVKSANLTALAGDERLLRERCAKLQREMLEWITGVKRSIIEFDGTFRSVFDLYETDPQSPFHRLKPGTKHPYKTYMRMMRAHIGHCHIDQTDGRDVRDWFKEWTKPEKEGDPRTIAKANMALAVLKSSLQFAIECRKPGCVEFRACIPKNLEKPKARRFAIPAGQVAKARAAAHEQQQPGAALAYALQFEGTLRQWDVIGQWVDMSDPRPSAIHHNGKKWFGPTWNDVDDNLILRWKPTKTEESSGEEIVIDLRACPMVMEELELTLAAGKPLSGPLVVDRRTGQPFLSQPFETIWRKAATAAGISKKVWNRDLRKSGSTEARRSGASVDDLQKLMGHVEGSKVTQDVYDLADLEAHRRIAASRVAFRKTTEK
ncbi:phage integrase [Afipia carboxidovorans OM5]|uniref:Putative integrase n=1 Tax=Afipia carboxidovorans (strain ATCC 49405 / DSM 1227 / KCTC 32145 / OM5) TaxID=504832 RepID=B6JHZ4_AFIC5|nr:tyrosine-type recombinase/integrase [Afipia carboxidovorans]ACI92661.1 phage integrase [Afipia carboxidovorans OM5]AEI03581.1 putative integrase [Afipia carboxidovorans OM4]AEI07158.1 putative integrase [Afipia carboxidovorans OM5]